MPFTAQLIDTMLEAHDRMHVESLDFLRTVAIPTVGVRATDFGLSPAKRDALYESGKEAARSFLQRWRLDEYVVAARAPSSNHQRAKVQRYEQRITRRASNVVGARVYRGV